MEAYIVLNQDEEDTNATLSHVISPTYRKFRKELVICNTELTLLFCLIASLDLILDDLDRYRVQVVHQGAGYGH